MKLSQENANAACDECAAFGRCILGPLGSDPMIALPGLKKGYAFEKGSIIPFSFNERTGFHSVRCGSVKVSFSRNVERAVKIAGLGDLVGYGHENMGGHFAEAVEYTETCFCPEEELASAIDRNPKVAKRLLKYSWRENWKANARIAGLADHSVKQRVICVLQDLARDFGAPSPHGKKIDLKISRSVLGELSGAVNETLARVLTELENEELIVREKWTIHVRQPIATTLSPRINS